MYWNQRGKLKTGEKVYYRQGGQIAVGKDHSNLVQPNESELAEILTRWPDLSFTLGPHWTEDGGINFVVDILKTANREKDEIDRGVNVRPRKRKEGCVNMERLSHPDVKRDRGTG